MEPLEVQPRRHTMEPHDVQPMTTLRTVVAAGLAVLVVSVAGLVVPADADAGCHCDAGHAETVEGNEANRCQP